MQTFVPTTTNNNSSNTTTTTTTKKNYNHTSTTATTTTPRFMRDGPKTLFSEPTQPQPNMATSSPGATKRVKMTGLVRTANCPEQQQQPRQQQRQQQQAATQPRRADQGAMDSLIDEVDRKMCKQVQHNLLRICELYAKSRSTTSLSDEEANTLRNEITELFSDVSRMEKSAIQNYKKKGIKRRRRRTIQLTSESKVSKACASCGTTTTSQWRRGNSQMLVLCNPCGLRFKRQEKEKAQQQQQQYHQHQQEQQQSFEVTTPPSDGMCTPNKGRIDFLLNEQPDVSPMVLGEARP